MVQSKWLGLQKKMKVVPTPLNPLWIIWVISAHIPEFMQTIHEKNFLHSRARELTFEACDCLVALTQKLNFLLQYCFDATELFFEFIRSLSLLCRLSFRILALEPRWGVGGVCKGAKYHCPTNITVPGVVKRKGLVHPHQKTADSSPSTGECLRNMS